MQKLADICIRRPVFASMIILAMVVVGAAAYSKLGVDRFPSVDLPTVRVSTRLPGASPAEMETEVARTRSAMVETPGWGIVVMAGVAGIWIWLLTRSPRAQREDRQRADGPDPPA